MLSSRPAEERACREDELLLLDDAATELDPEEERRHVARAGVAFEAAGEPAARAAELHDVAAAERPIVEEPARAALSVSQSQRRSVIGHRRESSSSIVAFERSAHSTWKQ